MANVSRTILHEARKYYPQSKIVFIDVPHAIARQRVKSRGREAGKRLKDRLARIRKRDIDMPPANITISNNGTIERAINELSDYLVTLYYATSSKGRTGDPSNDWNIHNESREFPF